MVHSNADTGGDSSDSDSEREGAAAVDLLIKFAFEVASAPQRLIIEARHTALVSAMPPLPLSGSQEVHRTLVETRVPQIVALRRQLCPAHMDEGRFWFNYFSLFHHWMDGDSRVLANPGAGQLPVDSETPMDLQGDGGCGKDQSGRIDAVHSLALGAAPNAQHEVEDGLTTMMAATDQNDAGSTSSSSTASSFVYIDSSGHCSTSSASESSRGRKLSSRRARSRSCRRTASVLRKGPSNGWVAI